MSCGNLQTVTQFAVWDFFRQVPDVPEAVANSLLLVGEGVSCHRCRRGGRGREEDSDTGLPILQGHLQLATPSPRPPSPARRTRSDSSVTVHSHQWAAYNRTQQLPSVATHNTVNHSLHFVDPATGVHTQNVESYWNRVKGKFKRMKGVHEDMLSSYLDEFMWRERHGRTASTALNNLFHDISLRYPQ